MNKSEELIDAITKLYDKLNDTDFSNDISQNIDSNTGIITGTSINYNNLLTIINTWQLMIQATRNVNEIIVFIQDNIVQSTINSINTIYNGFHSYSSNRNVQTINNIAGHIANLKSYMPHFIPYFKNKNVAKVIKKQWEFTEEKTRINNYLTESKKLSETLQKKDEVIDEFYQKLLKNTEEDSDDERGIQEYIKDCYDEIKKKYTDLYITNKESKIGDQEISAVGEINMVDLFVKDIYKNQEEVSALKTEIEQLKTNFNNQLEGNEESNIKGIKQSKKEYEGFMVKQQTEIHKLNDETKKALGNSIDALMVNTFKDEANSKKHESWFMMFLSLLSLVGIGFLGYKWLSAINVDTQLDWVMLIFRLSVFIPLGFAFWFCNKRHDVLSLLSAEYRYKQSICEAMIGYREKYETNQGYFSKEFAEEYAMFFQKTFTEINKNPAEKINKMLMKNSSSLKEITSLIEKASISRGGKKNNTSNDNT